MLIDRTLWPEIPLHHWLADLGMRLLRLRLGRLRHLPHRRLAGERASRALRDPPLPFAGHRLMDAVLRRQSRRRQLAPRRLQCHLRLELRRIPRPLARHPGPSFSQANRASPSVRHPRTTTFSSRWRKVSDYRRDARLENRTPRRKAIGFQAPAASPSTGTTANNTECSTMERQETPERLASVALSGEVVCHFTWRTSVGLSGESVILCDVPQ